MAAVKRFFALLLPEVCGSCMVKDRIYIHIYIYII